MFELLVWWASCPTLRTETGNNYYQSIKVKLRRILHAKTHTMKAPQRDAHKKTDTSLSVPLLGILLVPEKDVIPTNLGVPVLDLINDDVSEIYTTWIDSELFRNFQDFEIYTIIQHNNLLTKFVCSNFNHIERYTYNMKIT